MASIDGLDEQRHYADAYADMTAHLRTVRVIADGTPFAFGYLVGMIKRADVYSPADVAAFARGLQDAMRDHRNIMIDQMNEGMNAR